MKNIKKIIIFPLTVNAIKSSRESHHFLGLDDGGRITVYQTKGNKYSHVVLRGGTKPNYDSRSIKSCEKQLMDGDLPNKIMIDCSHGNTNKAMEMSRLSGTAQ